MRPALSELFVRFWPCPSGFRIWPWRLSKFAVLSECETSWRRRGAIWRHPNLKSHLPKKLEDFAQKSKFGRNFDFRAKKLKNKDDIRPARPMFPKSKKAGIFDDSACLASWSNTFKLKSQRNFNLMSKEQKMSALTFRSRDQIRVLRVYASQERSCECKQICEHAKLWMTLNSLVEISGPPETFLWDIGHFRVFVVVLLIHVEDEVKTWLLRFGASGSTIGKVITPNVRRYHSAIKRWLLR